MLTDIQKEQLAALGAKLIELAKLNPIICDVVCEENFAKLLSDPKCVTSFITSLYAVNCYVGTKAINKGLYSETQIMDAYVFFECLCVGSPIKCICHDIYRIAHSEQRYIENNMILNWDCVSYDMRKLYNDYCDFFKKI